MLQGLTISCALMCRTMGAQQMQPTSSDIKSIRANGTEISYIEQGTGQPLLLVHGSINDFRSWDNQIPAFSDHYHVIAYSRRYHWPNEWNSDSVDYTMQQHADDLAAFIQSLNLTDIVLIGHSYGASVALLTAMSHPELIERLILAEPLIMVRNPFSDSLAADREPFEARARQVLEKGDSIGALVEFGKYFDSAMTWEKLPQLTKQRRLDNIRSFALQLKAGPAGKAKVTRDDLRQLTMPVLLIQGDETNEFFKAAIGDIAACLPQAQQATISGAGHGLVAEKPAEFNESVLNFLEKK